MSARVDKGRGVVVLLRTSPSFADRLTGNGQGWLSSRTGSSGMSVVSAANRLVVLWLAIYKRLCASDHDKEGIGVRKTTDFD